MGHPESDIDRYDSRFSWPKRMAAPVMATIAISYLSSAPEAKAFIRTEFPCDPNGMSFNEPAKRILAQQCLKKHHEGKTIILGVGLTTEETADIALTASAILPDATDGIDTFTFIPVVASKEVEESFDNSNPTCADTNDVALSAAAIADTVMHLDADHIIAVTKKHSCDDHEDTKLVRLVNYGITWTNDAMRYGEVFGADTANKEKRQNYLEKTIIHERQHMDALGHAGRFSSSYTMDRSINERPTWFPVLPDDAEINLGEILHDPSGRYNQYGSPQNIMGNEYLNNSLQLNSVQRRYLNWPNIALGKTDDPLKRCSDQYVFIEDSSSRDHQFATYNLKSDPIQFDDGKGVLYDRVIVDPYVDDIGSIPGLVEIYLATGGEASLQTVSLGFLDLRNPEESHRLLTVMDDQIAISVAPGGIYVGPSMYTVK